MPVKQRWIARLRVPEGVDLVQTWRAKRSIRHKRGSLTVAIELAREPDRPVRLEITSLGQAKELRHALDQWISDAEEG